MTDYADLDANVVRPAAEGWRGEWEYILWVPRRGGGDVVLGPGALLQAPGPETTPAE